MEAANRKGPLAGFLVFDLGMNIAGPYAGSILSDLGATVIKVEAPEGDAGRTYPPVLPGPDGGLSILFTAMNHGKRYLSLDLRNPGAKEVVERIVDRSDVLIQNMRPGKADELGIGEASAHARNPRLVHCSVEAFYPQEGERPGYDLMVQAESGMLAQTGEEHGSPSRLPGPLLDHVAGTWVALGAIAALHGERDRPTVRVCMLDVAMSLMNDRATTYLATGEVPKRMGSALPNTTPHQSLPTSDGNIVVGAANNRLYKRLADLVGAPLAGDERYATQEGRLANRAELISALEQIFRTDTTASWLARLDAAGIPAGAVRELPDAVDRHRRMSTTGFAPIARVPGLHVVAPPVLFGDEPWAPPMPGQVGNDTPDVLRDVLGFDEVAVRRLLSDGVVC